MEKRRLGGSDFEVTAIGLGCWAMGGWLWGGTDVAAAEDAIRCAVDLGINFVDTAAVYGLGRSEEIVGRALQGRRDQVILATKCGQVWNRDDERNIFFTDPVGNKIYRNLQADSITQEVEDSLRRLRTDVIDVYQCHWPDVTTPLAETMEALVRLQEQGKIRAIGVSNFSVEEMEECLKHGEVASDQPQYNMLDREIEAEILPFLRERNIGLIAYSPLGRGILTGKVTMDRQFAKDDHRADQPWYQPNNRRRVLDLLEKIRPIADAHQATLAQLAANWVISQPGVTTALVGARNPAQVSENVKAGEFQLSADELERIGALLDGLGAPE